MSSPGTGSPRRERMVFAETPIWCGEAPFAEKMATSLQLPREAQPDRRSNGAQAFAGKTRKGSADWPDFSRPEYAEEKGKKGHAKTRPARKGAPTAAPPAQVP